MAKPVIKQISKDSRKTSAVFKNLKANKKYYVQVRSFKITQGLKYNSAWSSSKTVKPFVIKGTYIKEVLRDRRAFAVKWSRQSARIDGYHITGYQIQYSRAKNMTNVRSLKVKGYKVTSKKIKKLKANKKYYVRIRSYQKIAGKYYYSSWSKVKAVKTR